MAIQYTIRAKDSVTDDIYYVTVIGAFDPESDLNNPNTNNPPDPSSITIVSQQSIVEEFSLKDNYGIQAVSIVPSGLSSFDAVSHDFCDPTTWYQEASEVTGETLTTSDNLTFSFAYQNVIHYENVIDSEKVPMQKRLNVFIDNVAVDLSSALVDSIDYINGEITFSTPQTGVVTANYSYVDSSNPHRSRWTLTPTPGSVVAITAAKVKFSKNIGYPSPMTLNITINPLIIPSGIAASKKYRTLKEYVGFSSRWELLPAFGGFTNDIIHLLYDYKGSIVLNANYGMTAELSIDDNVPRTGEVGLVTFQCVRLK